MNTTSMDSRRLLVHRVQGGASLSEACRQAGVTRKTGRKWVRRAAQDGIVLLCEHSRAPKVVACRTSDLLETALVQMKEEYPEWGAKKLVVKLKERGIDVPVRTADRILSRHGLTTPRPRVPSVDPISFERSVSGALWQMDFKGLPASTAYAILTILDDCERFCLRFCPVQNKRGETVKEVLWELFGEHGLPDEMLMDNGDCWGSQCRSKAPTALEAYLMRLAIKPIHGRPHHPQTQGKVERFHETAVAELGDRLIQPTIDLARDVCQAFVHRYNWERPHESLGMKVPGSLYKPWKRKRPATPPAYIPEEGQITRRVDQKGIFRYKAFDYYLGQGLYREQVVIQEAEFGMRVFYAGFPLPYLHELNHARSEK